MTELRVEHRCDTDGKFKFDLAKKTYSSFGLWSDARRDKSRNADLPTNVHIDREDAPVFGDEDFAFHCICLPERAAPQFLSMVSADDSYNTAYNNCSHFALNSFVRMARYVGAKPGAKLDRWSTDLSRAGYANGFFTPTLLYNAIVEANNGSRTQDLNSLGCCCK